MADETGSTTPEYPAATVPPDGQGALLESLSAISEALTSGGDLTAALQTIAAQSLRLLNATTARIRLPDSTGTQLILAACVDDEDASVRLPPPDPVSYLATDSIAGKAFRTNRIYVARGAPRRGVPEDQYAFHCTVPLTTRKRVLGVLTIWRANDETFSADDIALARIFGNAAALAIEQVRLLAAERDRTRRMETLTEVARIISTATDRDALYEAVHTQCVRLFGVEHFYIGMTGPDDAIYPVLWYSYGERRDDIKGKPVGGSLGRHVVMENRPINVPDAGAEYERRGLMPHYAVWGHDGSTFHLPWMGVPIRDGDRASGVIVANGRAEPYTDEECAVLLAVADQVGVALRNITLLEEQRARAERTETLIEVARVISTATDRDELYEAVYAQCVRIFGVRDFHIALADASGQPRSALWYSNGRRHREFEGAAHPPTLGSYVLRENCPINALDEHAEYVQRGIPIPDGSPFGEAGRTSRLPWLGVPIRNGDHATGVISTYGRDEPYTDEEFVVLLAIADQVGVALRNIALLEEQRARAARMETLTEVARAISATTDLGPLYEAVRQQCARLFSVENFYIAHLNALTGEVIPDLWYTRGRRLAELEGDPLEGGLSPIVARTRQPLVAADYVAACAERGIPIYYPTRPEDHGAWMGVPLIAGQEMLGVMVVNGKMTPYTPEEQEAFIAIANQVSVALTNARLLQEQAARASRLAALAEISRAISAITDTDRLYDVVYRECGRLLPVANARIVRIEPETGEMIAECYFRDGERVREAEGQALVGGLGPLIRDTGRPLMTNDYPGELVRRGLAMPNAPLPPEGSSWLGVPVMQGAQVYGVISLNTTERQLTAEDRDTLLAIANQVGIAMANARLLAAQQARATRMATLTEVARIISATTNHETLYDAVYQQCVRLFGAENIRISRFDEEKRELTPEYWYSDGVRRVESEGIPATFGLSFIVTETRRPFVTDDYYAECIARGIPITATLAPGTPLGTRAWMGAPLLAGETLLGTVGIYGKETPYAAEEQEAFIAIANQMSVAIQNIELIDRERLRVERLAILNEMSRAMSAVLDRDELLHVIQRETPRLFASQTLLAAYWDEERAWFHEETRNEGIQVFPFAEVMEARTLTRTVVEREEMIVVHDYEEAMARHGSPPRRFPYVDLPTGWIGAPLKTKGRLHGIIAAFIKREDLTDNNIRMLDFIARQAGIALENARLLEEERTRAERLATLNDISRAINAVLDLEPLLRTIARESTRLTDIRYPLIAHRLANGGWINATGAGDLRLVSEGSGIGPLGTHMLETRTPLAVRDYESACRERGITPSPPAAVTLPTGWIGAPMVIGTRPVGVLAGFIAPEKATDENAQLLSILANGAAVAIENARLYHDAQELGVVEERNRLAREIHDTIAQGLTATTYQLELVDTFLTMEPPKLARAQEKVQRALELTRANLDEARRSVMDLRAAHLQNVTLPEAFERLGVGFTADTGVAVVVAAADGFPALPSPISAGLYRVGQEALANIAKHAQATRVEIAVAIEGDAVTLHITDDGVGFDPAYVAAQRTARGTSGGFGLIGIRERAQLMGGTSDVTTDVGAGTQIVVRVPLKR